jgi:hypothetical protein
MNTGDSENRRNPGRRPFSQEDRGLEELRTQLFRQEKLLLMAADDRTVFVKTVETAPGTRARSFPHKALFPNERYRQTGGFSWQQD